MAMLILVVTTGFSISQHFCQGELLYSSVLGNAASCEMAKSKETLPPCHKQDHTGDSAESFSKMPCCEDYQAAIAGQDIPTPLKKGDNLLPSVKFLTAFSYVFFHKALLSDKDFHFVDYRPPLISRDIPVFFQSFLI
ncbi:hypothetical protein EDD80_1075 [Anseongella ginsenosidimutans]|uniref:Uncharacterized protein n=2 Tax=Anseongella ginsenosidimutans TaxID=496056 RepID=A0A4R3KP89_9SPHI|nr:hypothetical protein [Anseongella ginsenosidimutans]QEC52558.1 hypothetical protein FRZ59_09560 [Anseongella ginsenosidimutans]TCS86472.1 hypothetical protein EDD80_1075 [Anseongella ginsenosidimutans]